MVRVTPGMWIWVTPASKGYTWHVHKVNQLIRVTVTVTVRVRVIVRVSVRVVRVRARLGLRLGLELVPGLGSGLACPTR